MAPYKCHNTWPLADDESGQERYLHGASVMELLVVHVGGKAVDVADETPCLSLLVGVGGQLLRLLGVVVRFTTVPFVFSSLKFLSKVWMRRKS